MANLRKIDVFDETADLLEARAAARGQSVPDLVADLVVEEEVLDRFEKLRTEGKGPWSPEILAEDARRWEEFQRTGEGVPFEEVEAWANGLGTAHELPFPKPRKL